MQIRQYIHEAFICCLLAGLTGCGHFNKPHIKKLNFYATPATAIDIATQPDTVQKTITVWIHGTRFFFRPFYHQTCKGKDTLVPLKEVPLEYGPGKAACSLVNADPAAFCADDFYIFGWSGRLNFDVRFQSAKNLYNLLHAMTKEYRQKYNHAPFIRIITHSHGGNVALNMALCQLASSDLAIDELILLACPVQSETKDLIHDSFFKKVISLYSSIDIIQIIDPQALYKTHRPAESFFSKRLFHDCAKLQQAKIMMNNRAITHDEFVYPAFLKFLPSIILQMNDWPDETDQYGFKKRPKKLICLDNKPQEKIRA